MGGGHRLRAGSVEMTGGPTEHAPASTPRASHARSSATDAAKAPSDRFRASCRAGGGRDEACPLSTGGETRRVQLVRGEGRGVSS